MPLISARPEAPEQPQPAQPAQSTLSAPSRTRLEWSAPHETVGAVDAMNEAAFGPIEPLPTSDPIRDLRRRDDQDVIGTDTCGFLSINNVIPLTCQSNAACYLGASSMYMGCCSIDSANGGQSSECSKHIPTTCFNSKDSPKTCGGETLCCTESTNTECNVWSLYTYARTAKHQNAGNTTTLFNCGPTSTIGTIVASTTLLHLSSDTYTANGTTATGYSATATLQPLQVAYHASHNHTVGIVVGIVVAIVAIIAAAAAFCFFKRKRSGGRGGSKAAFATPSGSGFMNMVPWGKKNVGSTGPGAKGGFQVLSDTPSQQERYQEHAYTEQRLLPTEPTNVAHGWSEPTSQHATETVYDPGAAVAGAAVPTLHSAVKTP